jgi:peptidoglycan/LPS O-acetylase OafA/YrhL
MRRAMKNERLAELEGVRGLMAWWVVAGHVAWFFSDRVGDLIHNDSAVLVFMALSGFVITSLVCDRREPYGAFMIRRVFRLWPAYLIALAISAATLSLQASAMTHAPFHPRFADFRLANIAASQGQFWPHLAAHLAMVQGLIPDAMLPHGSLAILGQAWSLSVELQFYLIAPLLVWLIGSGRAGIAAAVALGVCLFLLGVHGPLRDNSAFIGRYAPWFAIGIASLYLWRGRDERNIAMFVGGFCALVAAYGVLTREPAAVVWIGVLAALFWVGSLRRLLGRPILKRLGEASYSTYLFHMLPLYLGAYGLNFLGLDRWVYLAALTLVTVGVTLAASLLSYRFVEKPAMALGARLAKAWFADRRPAEIAVETLTGP